MNRFSLIAVAGGLSLLTACSQEELSTGGHKNVSNFPISFRAGVETRVNPDLDYTNNPSTFYVTAYSNGHKATNNVLTDPLFKDEPFYLMGANLYASTSNQKWPNKQDAGMVEFFAYAPSLEEMHAAALSQLDPTASNYQSTADEYLHGMQFYNLCQDGVALDPLNQQNGTFDGVQLYKGFKLGRFYVATDIAQQVDFITAHVAAETPENEDESKIGVKLAFKHQLSNIELRAFANNEDYNIEIAGIRLGRPYTGGAIFNFCDAEGNVSYAEGGQWGISKKPQRMPVEYIYGPGDEIYRMGAFNSINGNQIVTTASHTSAASAVSIMGKGGNAMVLPTKNAAWAGEDNPWIASKYQSALDGKDPLPWDAEKQGDMYFSILIRVTLKPNANEVSAQQIYPYGNNTNMNVVYFEKEQNSNKIIGRLPSKISNVGANNELVEFGWASVPVGVDWERGKKYIYTLDFSDGVGIQDPEDARPGTPIVGDGIKFSVSVTPWDEKMITLPIPEE